VVRVKNLHSFDCIGIVACADRSLLNHFTSTNMKCIMKCVVCVFVTSRYHLAIAIAVT
jgi:hypothetical protein